MKLLTLTLACSLWLSSLFGQGKTKAFTTSDIDNFWKAFDKITATKDSALQYQYLKTLYLDKGTPGLKAIMEVRNFTAASYINAINHYPLFWKSIRINTTRAAQAAATARAEIVKLKKLYPALQPATSYFTIGALGTNGTASNGMVLIGTELAFADEHTVASEFPGRMAGARKQFFSSNPINDIVLLNVHEYIHTNQRPIVDNLLSQCIYEGVAEFLSCYVTGKPSAVPAVHWGKKNEDRVRKKFEQDMFNVNRRGLWLWSDQENEFGMRDLGYYVGYTLCERYLDKSKDKKQAVKEMIELDYTNEKMVEQFVDSTGFFSAPLNTLYDHFESRRPVVTGIDEFSNGNQAVNAHTGKITVRFSEPMDTLNRGFDYGPLGENNVLRVRRFIGFSADAMSVSFEVELQPGRQYQVQLTSRFRSREGFPLKSYLIDIRTAEK